jgi:ribonuclease HII
VDGNRFYPYQDIPFTCVIKGDAIYASIASASVLAKTWRDEYMLNLHRQISHYGWNKNKGYPTAEHRAAIAQYGASSFHRKSFSLFDNRLKYNL